MLGTFDTEEINSELDKIYQAAKSDPALSADGTGEGASNLGRYVGFRLKLGCTLGVRRALRQKFLGAEQAELSNIDTLRYDTFSKRINRAFADRLTQTIDNRTEEPA
jgi:hypothetical protein